MKYSDPKISNSSRILIVHHWDCDGLCSAALLSSYLKEANRTVKIEMLTPEIGNYFLVEDEFKNIKEYDPQEIFIVDMAMPAEVVRELKNISGRVTIFDHHRQQKIGEVRHINPNINSKKGIEAPSCGWVINDFFGEPQDILSVLGAVGDQGDNLDNMEKIKCILAGHGLQLKDCMELVKNIDSSYIAGKTHECAKTVSILASIKRGEENIDSLLDDKTLLQNRKDIASHIRTIIETGIKKDDIKKIIFKRFKSPYHIISDVARDLSARFVNYLVVVINHSGPDRANIYLRTGDQGIDLSGIIKYSLKKGYNAGGKREVVGVILPKSDVDNFLKDTLKYLGK